jgi:uncharacterized protein YbbK (DUF523 family)
MSESRKTLLVSACLLGLHTKYNGGHNENNAVYQLSSRAVMLPICPEQLGGLSTPRPAAEIIGGDGQGVWKGTAQVATQNGDDRTEAFLRGARETWQMALALGAQAALFKAHSPSCGCGEIYDGSFTGHRKAGDGVAASFLKAKGLPVFTEENLTELNEWLTAGES